jgi:hypothetical protein
MGLTVLKDWAALHAGLVRAAKIPLRAFADLEGESLDHVADMIATAVLKDLREGGRGNTEELFRQRIDDAMQEAKAEWVKRDELFVAVHAILRAARAGQNSLKIV